MRRLLATLWALLMFGPVFAADRFYDPGTWGPYLLLGAIGAALSAMLWRIWPEPPQESPFAPRGWILLAVPLWVIAIGVFLNARLDDSLPELRAAEFVGCERSTWRFLGSTCTVRDLAPGGEELMLAHGVPRSGGVLVRGDRLTLHLRRGRFGWSWIAQVVNDSALAERAAAK